MKLEDMLRNGQRKALLELAGADEDGKVFPPAHNRNVVKLVAADLARAEGNRYFITDAGWAWLRQAIEDGVPAQVGATSGHSPVELRMWRQVRSDFADAGVRLPDID